MSRTVNNYRVYCDTETAFFTTWGTATPTTCPNNASHTINADLTTVVDSVNNNVTYIQGKSYGGTQGYYRMEGGEVMIAAGSNTTSSSTVSFPYPICLYGSKIVCTPVHIGDKLDLCLAPDTTVGVLTSAASIGDTTFHVNSTVIQNFTVGFDLALVDSTNGNTEALGPVASIDAVAGTITMSTPCTSAFPAYSTYVQLTLFVGRNINIGACCQIKVGYGTLSGKTLPANTACKIIYHNIGGQAKQVTYVLEYNY
jgi:hypothetical protein